MAKKISKAVRSTDKAANKSIYSWEDDDPGFEIHGGPPYREEGGAVGEAPVNSLLPIAELVHRLASVASEADSITEL